MCSTVLWLPLSPHGYSYKASCATCVPDRDKQSLVIFDIRTLWRSGLSVRVPGCQKLQMTVWHRMAYSCSHNGTVDVKGLNVHDVWNVLAFVDKCWQRHRELLRSTLAVSRSRRSFWTASINSTRSISDDHWIITMWTRTIRRNNHRISVNEPIRMTDNVQPF